MSLDNPTKIASSPYVHQDIEYDYTLVHAYLGLGVQAAAIYAQLETLKPHQVMSVQLLENHDLSFHRFQTHTA